MGGWYLRMTWGQEVCYASLHSEPVSTLGLPTVWSLWGNPGMARCWEMSTLPAGYIPSTKWHRQTAVGHWVSLCVWSVVGWLIVYQDGNYLYPGQYSQTICWLQIRWYRLRAGTFSWQDPVHSWKAGPGEVLTVENLLHFIGPESMISGTGTISRVWWNHWLFHWVACPSNQQGISALWLCKKVQQKLAICSGAPH